MSMLMSSGSSWARRAPMPAYQLYLEPWLESAVMDEVLSLQEAWLIQDEHLVQMQEEVVMPQELWPALSRLRLWEMPPHGPLQ